VNQMIHLRRSTVLADSRGRRRSSRPQPSVVRVGDFGGYEWAGFSGTRGFGDVSVGGGSVPLWIVVSTTMSRDDKPETKTAIPVDSVVRFTVQNGIRDVSDDADMAILRGKVVTTRNPLTPDSYGIQVTEVVDTHKLDPAVSPPIVGQVFLVAPSSIASVESIGSAPPPTMVIYSTSEWLGQMPQAKPTEVVATSTPATPAPETTPSPSPTPTASTTPWGTIILGVVAVLAVGSLIWRAV